MLIPFSRLSTDDQALCLQNGWIAYDPKFRSTLRKAGEAAPGKPARYFFYIPGLMMRVIWARSDQEAIDIANLPGV